jgi:hypothetical protein
MSRVFGLGFNAFTSCATRRIGWLTLWYIVGMIVATPVPAAEEGTRNYELPAGDAATALRLLSEVSGREVLFAAEAVRGVRTNAVRGQLTALEAARQMVAGTKLAVTQDEKTGAIAIHHPRPPNPAPPRRAG